MRPKGNYTAVVKGGNRKVKIKGTLCAYKTVRVKTHLRAIKPK